MGEGNREDGAHGSGNPKAKGKAEGKGKDDAVEVGRNVDGVRDDERNGEGGKDRRGREVEAA